MSTYILEGQEKEIDTEKIAALTNMMNTEMLMTNIFIDGLMKKTGMIQQKYKSQDNKL